MMGPGFIIKKYRRDQIVVASKSFENNPEHGVPSKLQYNVFI